MPPETTISAEALQALCQALSQESLTLRMMLTEERIQRAALQTRVAELEAKYEPKKGQQKEQAA